MRRVGQLPRTPHRTDPLGIRRQQNAVGRTGRGQQLLGLGHFEVLLQTCNHYHYQRRTQRAVLRLVDDGLRGVGILQAGGFGQQRAHLLAGRAFYGKETPWAQLTVVGRTHGGGEQQVALLLGRCRFQQTGHGNTVEQSVESLHWPPPEKNVRSF